MSDTSLLDQWRDTAYDRELTKNQLETFWSKYLIKSVFTKTWWMQKQTGCMNFRSGMRFLTRTRKSVFTASRNSPVRSAKTRRSEETIRVRAEAVRNIKNAVDVTHNRSFICGFIFLLSGSAVSAIIS